MKSILKFFTRPWGLLFLAAASFSLSLYILTGFFVIWGFTFLASAIIRAFTIEHGDIVPRRYDD